MLSATEIVLSISLETSSGRRIDLKRAGVFPDLFVDEVGRVFKLSIPAIYDNNGTPAIKYLGHTIPQAHIVADAHFPGWSQGSETSSVRPKDDNWWNLHPHNLQFVEERARGRPRSSVLRTLFMAIEVARLTQDLDIAAEETGLTVPTIASAIIEHAPWMVSDGLKGFPKHLLEPRIGGKRQDALRRRYTTHNNEHTPDDPNRHLDPD